jgi:hypothetical protein
MTKAQVQQLPKSEQRHFMECPACNGWLDMRNLREVMFHEMGHVEPGPDVPDIKGVRMAGPSQKKARRLPPRSRPQ